MSALRPIALAAALVALASCSRIPIAEPDLEGEYGAALKNEVRRAAIYQGLETRLFVHVVWLRPELVRAQAKFISEMRAEPTDLAQQRLEKMQVEYAAPTFFAITYMPLATWDDWDSKQSVWRLALEGGPRGEVAPTSVKRFNTPFNAELISLYPFLDDFVTGYRIQFPEGSLGAGESPKLLISGALGKVELDWAAPYK